MAYVKPIEGLALKGYTDSGHQVPIDTKKEAGGFESAATPMELLLQALMGCTAMDVISILKKMKVDYHLFEVHETNERSDEHPKVYTKIHLTFRFEGEDLDHEKLKKAVYLSKDRYCSVSAMLKQTVEISYEITVNGQSVDRSGHPSASTRTPLSFR
ncbi:MAG: OsmC family protein [Candidatus Thermoplasmatota archaeon]|nr:OsmC family protein [Candidatus Thermoplasmatota archaeon]